MYDIKPWYRSTGVVGALIVLAGACLNLLGIHASSDDLVLLCRELTTLAGAVGGVMALIGRLKATAAIGKPALITGSYVGGTLQSFDPPAEFVAVPAPQTPQPEAPPVQASPEPQPAPKPDVPSPDAPQAPAGQ